MYKKIISAVTALTLTAGALALPVAENTSGIKAGITASANNFISGNYEYKILEDGTASICKYYGSDENLQIPAKLDGKKVTEVTISGSVGGFSSDEQRDRMYAVKSIKVPEGVKTIGGYCFSGMANVKSIKLPGTLTKIGVNAFEYCQSLESITIPSKVSDMGSCAFQNCASLKKVTIKNGVKVIGQSAFTNCPKLKSLTIPKSVTEFRVYAFGTDSNYQKTPGFTVKCYKYSEAYNYAKENGFKIAYIKEKLTSKNVSLTDSVVVKVGKNKLKKGVDYTSSVKYSSKTGKAKVTVVGKGAYTGKIVKTFKVKPAKQKIKSVKNTKSQITVNFRKDSVATAYENVVCDNSRFSGGRIQTFRSENNTQTKFILQTYNLEKGRKYYFRVRSYRKLGKKKIYGGWSKTKVLVAK